MITGKKYLQPVLFFLTALALSVSTHATSSTDNMDSVKADYLLTLINYIDWQSIKPEHQAVTVCVTKLGDFSQALRAKSTSSRHQKNTDKVTINIVKAEQETINQCHLVYFVDNENARHFLDNNLLKVGASPELSDSGTAINFYEHRGKVRLEIFPHRLKKQNINLSSEVLKLARINKRK